MRDTLRWGWMSCPGGNQRANIYRCKIFLPMPKFLGRFSRRGFLAFLPEAPALDCCFRVSNFSAAEYLIGTYRERRRGRLLRLGRHLVVVWRLSLREKPLANAHSLESFCCSKSEGTLLPPYTLAISLSPCSVKKTCGASGAESLIDWGLRLPITCVSVRW